MQHSSAQPPVRTLRIGADAEDRPATRRTVIAACVLAAVAIHGALAFVPLNLGGTAAEYGIAVGDRVEVTLMFESEELAPAEEPAPMAVELPAAPEPVESIPDMQVAAVEELIAPAPDAVPAAAPIQKQRVVVAKPVAASTPAARNAGGGQRTMAKPDYLRNPPPQYPAESRKLREEGVVLLKVAVTAAGRAADVQLQRSSGHSRLDEAALRAVRRWEFKPARVGLTAVACAVEVPVRFGLN